MARKESENSPAFVPEGFEIDSIDPTKPGSLWKRAEISRTELARWVRENGIAGENAFRKKLESLFANFWEELSAVESAYDVSNDKKTRIAGHLKLAATHEYRIFFATGVAKVVDEASREAWPAGITVSSGKGGLMDAFFSKYEKGEERKIMEDIGKEKLVQKFGTDVAKSNFEFRKKRSENMPTLHQWWMSEFG